jgi:hypothetical protein
MIGADNNGPFSVRTIDSINIFSREPSAEVRDTVVIWQELAKAIRVTLPKHESFTSDEDVTRAFSRWIDDNKHALAAIKQIVIEHKDLTHVPVALCRLTGLKDLFLRHNKLNLSPLPEAISSLTALQRLFISDNQLDRLPEAIGRLTALKVLDLGTIDSHKYQVKLAH